MSHDARTPDPHPSTSVPRFPAPVATLHVTTCLCLHDFKVDRRPRCVAAPSRRGVQWPHRRDPQQWAPRRRRERKRPTAGLCSNVRLTAMTAGENAPTAENESRKAIEISSHGVRWHDRLSRANRKDIVKAQCRALPRAVPWSVGSTSLASSKRASKIDRPATDSESRSRRYICACAARRTTLRGDAAARLANPCRRA